MSDKRIVIRRGTHRDEAVAFYLARQVCRYIQELGYPCVLETKPLSATAWGEMLRGRKKRFDFKEKGIIYFSFHSTPLEFIENEVIADSGITCGGMPSIHVDMPAVYRKITNPHILERREQWANGDKQRLRYADNYMREVADVKASIEAGLAGDDVVREIAKVIIEYTNGETNV